MTTDEAIVITRLYILIAIGHLILWNFIVHYISGGKVNIPKQAAKWCKKYLILILTIGFVLGHWFAQMNYYYR